MFIAIISGTVYQLTKVLIVTGLVASWVMYRM